jgi:hypothetical protein
MFGPTTGTVNMLANKRQQPAKEDGKEIASALKDFRKAISNAISSDADRKGLRGVGRVWVDSPLMAEDFAERAFVVPIIREMEVVETKGCTLRWNEDDDKCTSAPRHRVVVPDTPDTPRGAVKACAPGSTCRHVQLPCVSTHSAVAVTTEARFTFIPVRDGYRTRVP